MKIRELFEANGVEWQVIHNMSGTPKKFKRIDGDWEKPSEARRWMTSTELSKSAQKAQTRMASATRTKVEKTPIVDLQAIYNKIMQVVGNVFPDGDPIDHLIPYFKRMGIEGFEIGETISKAMKKHGHGIEKKGLYAYMGSMWDDMSKDALHDAKNSKTKIHSPFIEYDEDGKLHVLSNPWK